MLYFNYIYTFKVALYNTMMDVHQQEDDWKHVQLEYDKAAHSSWGNVDIRYQVSGLGVNLVACQKVVGWETARSLKHDSIQVYFYYYFFNWLSNFFLIFR